MHTIMTVSRCGTKHRILLTTLMRSYLPKVERVGRLLQYFDALHSSFLATYNIIILLDQPSADPRSDLTISSMAGRVFVQFQNRGKGEESSSLLQ